jgi:NAD(P)-dependent dehydrogenase (short-subunit alcohol dehydrogenase family)
MQASYHLPKAALITGGARRIGAAIAHALAERGFSIALHCRESVADAEVTAAELRARGVQVVVLQAALDREADVRRLVPDAVAAIGPLGVLVNNASTFERDEWHDATRESWDAHIEPNLRAPFVLMQDFARALPKDAGGLIVNMLDQRVWSITPHFVSYTVSKTALWSLTQQMALALAPRIRVNGIGPGPTVPSPRQTQAQFDAQCASVPLQHGSSPAEIGRAVLAMLDLPSLTGQMMALDGGQHLQWSPAGIGTALEE